MSKRFLVEALQIRQCLVTAPLERQPLLQTEPSLAYVGARDGTANGGSLLAPTGAQSQ